jgi:hypothetical protein
MSTLLIPLLPKSVNSLDHPSVKEFRELIEGGTKAYNCKLTSFAIDHGVVAFSVDSDELYQHLKEDLKRMGLKVVEAGSENQFVVEGKKILKRARED